MQKSATIKQETSTFSEFLNEYSQLEARNDSWLKVIIEIVKEINI